MKMLHTANNKQNQLPENLSLDKNVDVWAVWFCLSPLPTMRGDLTKTVTNGLSMTNDRERGIIKCVKDIDILFDNEI